MNKKRIVWRQMAVAVIFFAILYGSHVSGQAQSAPPAVATDEATMPAFAPGEVLVGMRLDGVRASSLLSTMNVNAIELVDECQSAAASDSANYLLHVAAGSELSTVEQLQQDPAVLFAEPNWYVYAADLDSSTEISQPETPFQVNDPGYVAEQWYLPRIGAGRAWGLVYDSAGFGGQVTTIQVAVIDSGADFLHPELAGRLLPGKNYITPGSEPIDKYGHATHVSGIIGAITNNSVGIAGVAPQVLIDPRKVLNDAGSGTIDPVARGICEAADAGAKIINLSLETSGFSATLEQAVQYAQAKGALLIAASGNSGYTSAVAYPAAFPEVMAVAALTYDGGRASYSNYITTTNIIEIAAPGGTLQQPIYSTWATGVTCRLTSNPQNDAGYCNNYGTSMAAAVVSGAAALVWSLDPDLTAQQVRAVLTESAAPIGLSSSQVGSGLLDLQAAVRKVLPSQLQLSKSSVVYTTSSPGSPYTVTVRVENPSGQPIDWEAGLLGAPTWLHLSDINGSGLLTGTTTYGQPGHFSLVLADPNAAPGKYAGTAQVVGTRANTTQIIQQLPVDFQVGPLMRQLYFPMVAGAINGTIPPVSASWEMPTNANNRTVLSLDDDGVANLSLPFDFPLQGNDFGDVQVYANGFVSFNNIATVNAAQNECLGKPDSDIGDAVYGWWADLDPTANGAQVSIFEPATDRFVIEFANVSTSAKADEHYTVNFQIVLYANGNVSLNYGQLPSLQAVPPPVTIGVEARDGLFYNQIACKDAQTELGFLPRSNQTIMLQAEGSVY